MKFLYRKFLTALLFLFFAFNAKAVNDTLTIGEAFGWKQGDTLVFVEKQEEYQMLGSQTVTIPHGSWQKTLTVDTRIDDSIGINITLRDVYTNDTIILYISNRDSSIESFKGFNGIGVHELSPDCDGQDTFYGCDSLAYSCFENYGTDINFDSATTFSLQNSFFESYTYATYEKVLGIVNFGNSWLQIEGDVFACNLKLIHYASDSINWNIYNGITEPATSLPFSLYPNPANDEITITTENEATVDVYIYDMLGNCVVTHKNFSSNPVKENLSRIPPGYYLLKLTDQRGLSSTKSFVIAR